ncbi:MAG: hypothetical protein RQ763_03730 [Sulfurimonas sp.]|uniref:hypothetical protein n=1 Tax=Sulfurimonas sp. TaxID=2022749 RepID=UPI0028CD0E76|nr:hypothetical protein [Sulfurimonas sp.]MDT8338291.1 hypothetical protein [Sulfurimonas sp.]
MYTIKFDPPPAGYSATEARSGENVSLITRQFISSEDGDEFINRLDGIPTQVINLLPKDKNIRSSMVDNMLAIFYKDGKCEVFLNELNLIAKARVKKSIKKGDPVYEDDFADIISLEFEDVDIPKDVGYFVILSKGWRKGFFFDFTPIVNNDYIIDYDIWSSLGHFYNYLFFQDLHKISDAEWEKLFEKKWFPFIGLKKKTITSLLNYIKANWDCDELLSDIAIDIEEVLPEFIEKWSSSHIFAEHIGLLKHAFERFKEKDYISSTSILFPRIEGVLRSINQSIDCAQNTQKKLAQAPMQMSQIHKDRYSRILPAKFSDYLSKIYFADFAPGKPADISRNSVGHGVANSSDFSLKSSIIGFLVLEQIFYHNPTDEEENNEKT